MQRENFLIHYYYYQYAFFLFGCGEEAAPPLERIRAIKTITVAERVTRINRNFPGTVEAVDKSSLSFEVSGNVKELGVEVGDTVKKGQEIATPDRHPFELKVQAAKAKVKNARVDLKHPKKNLERFQEVRKKDPGAISLRHLDQAEAAYDRAKNTLSFSSTQLNLAIRDLEKTKLAVRLFRTLVIYTSTKSPSEWLQTKRKKTENFGRKSDMNLKQIKIVRTNNPFTDRI